MNDTTKISELNVQFGYENSPKDLDLNTGNITKNPNIVFEESKFHLFKPYLFNFLRLIFIKK